MKNYQFKVFECINPMESIYYIGLDVHKKSIAYCIKTVTGKIACQGKVKAERRALQQWLVDLPGSWVGAMEATMFTGWIYDFLKPYAVELQVAHPAMLKAITAAKKKNDRGRCREACRPPAGESAAGMHHDVGRVAGVTKNFTLSEHDSPHFFQDEDQDFRVVDGSWRSL
jgi:hypothetical protein